MSIHATFLGTGGAIPTMARTPNVLLMSHDGKHLLFDCGESTQRQMVRYEAGLDVSHLFVTYLHGDHILGIPGLIQTFDFNDRDDSLVIHDPPRNRGHLGRLVHTDGYQPGFHISIHEIRPGSVAYRADDYEVHAFDTEHQTASVGYVLVEDDRPGRFDREKAEELGVPVGPAFGRLHTGEDVELRDGTVVRFEQVVGDPRPDRTAVYTDDIRPFNSTVEVACDADLPVHDTTFTDGETKRAKQTAHSTAREAARVARGIDVRRFVLMCISARYAANPSPFLEQAHEVYDGEAFIAGDGRKLGAPYADNDGGGAETGE